MYWRLRMEKPKKMYAKSYILNRKIVVYNADEIDKWHNHVTQPLDEAINEYFCESDKLLTKKDIENEMVNALLEYKKRKGE